MTPILCLDTAAIARTVAIVAIGLTDPVLAIIRIHRIIHQLRQRAAQVLQAVRHLCIHRHRLTRLGQGH